LDGVLRGPETVAHLNARLVHLDRLLVEGFDGVAHAAEGGQKVSVYLEASLLDVTAEVAPGPEVVFGEEGGELVQGIHEFLEETETKGKRFYSPLQLIHNSYPRSSIIGQVS
jgi:hypothetical protein